MKVYVVHDKYTVFGVMTDLSRAISLQILASSELAKEGAIDTRVSISEQNLDEPEMGGC